VFKEKRHAELAEASLLHRWITSSSGVVEMLQQAQHDVLF
jgi:hypothetical protein